MYINESGHKDNDWIKNVIKEISIFYEHGFKTPEDILNVIDTIDALSKMKGE